MYRDAKNLPFSPDELLKQAKVLYQKQHPDHQYMGFVREHMR
jgi:hypothetical protein